MNKIQQHPLEIAEYVDFIRSKFVKSYLEIGAKFGGSVWAISNVLPKGSRIVAVDLPNGHWGRSDSEVSLRTCFNQLKIRGFDAHLFIGDSTSQHIADAVRSLAPFDCLLIDANHTERYVRADFLNYGKLAKHCCFHDIGWNQPPQPGRMPIEVPKVWREFRETFREAAEFREIKRDVGHNGIGIISWK
jgi:hypothetical protein